MAQYDDDWRPPRNLKGGPSKVEYQYSDGSSETRTVSRKGPNPPSKYITKNQDGEVPEGIKITSKPRASGALRRKFIQHLGTAYAEEYINKEEFDARHAQADKAETDAELRVLIADLPSLPAPEAKKPRLTWGKFKTDFWKTVSGFWETSMGTFTKCILLLISYGAGFAVGIIPACVLLVGKNHVTGLHSGLAATAIVLGALWTIGNIIATVCITENL